MKPSKIPSLFLFALTIFQHCAHEYEFTNDAPSHSIASVSPLCGRTGDTVTITGKNFSDISAKNTVLFNGTKAAVLLASSTYLTTIVPAGAPSGNISVAIDKTKATGPRFSFTPTGIVTIANSNMPYVAGLAVDAQRNMYIVRDNFNRIDKRSPNGSLTIFAGGGRAGNTNGFADGFGRFALFQYPADVAVDSKGNVFVSDKGNNCIRKITPDGAVSLYAGVYNNQYLYPLPGYRDGLRTEAYFDSPDGLFIDANDNLYVCDAGNVRVRKITPDSGNNLGVVSTIAGTGQYGAQDGPALQATFSFLKDLVVDNDGNIFLTEQYEDAKVRKISATGTVATVMAGPYNVYRGCGDDAYVVSITDGIALGPEGNLYVSMYAGTAVDDFATYENKIITIAPDNTISTLAGGSGDRAPLEGIGENVYFTGIGNLLLVDNVLYMGTDNELVQVALN